MAEAKQQLDESLYQSFQNQTLVLFGTVDHETGSPAVSAISWVHANDAKHLRIALDQRSRMVANVQKQSLVTVTVFAEQTVFTIYGQAEIISNELDDVPLNLACIEVSIHAIRDAMFYGSRISVMPEYEKTYDLRAAEKLDNQVFAAMKKA